MKGKFDAIPGRSAGRDAASWRGRVGPQEAEGVALAALTYLGEDEGRLARFLEASGLAPEDLRRAAAEPGFLAGVLDHVMADEALVVAFAEAIGRPPEAVGQAWALLSGPPAIED